MTDELYRVQILSVGDVHNPANQKPMSFCAATALQLVAVLSAAELPTARLPEAAPKHGVPTAGLGIAEARRDLFQWACAQSFWASSIPCKNVKYANDLAKVKDATQKAVMIMKHKKERNASTTKTKVARLDEAWLATKTMYTAFCARTDKPAESKVCTNLTMKKTFTVDKRPSSWGGSPPSKRGRGQQGQGRGQQGRGQRGRGQKPMGRAKATRSPPA